MKLLILLLAFTQVREGKIIDIHKSKKIDAYVVTFRHYREVFKVNYQCLPDTFRVGKYITNIK
jgi:hypothetical protein